MYINLLLMKTTLSYATGLLEAYITAPCVRPNIDLLLLLRNLQMNIIP